MLSLIAELFQMAWIAVYLVGGAILLPILYFAPGWKKKLLGGAIVVSVLGTIYLLSYFEGQQAEDALVARNRAMNAQFTKRCTEDARISIKRVVEDVDGIFLLKPRNVATSVELQDQFWMGDPYGYSSFEAKHPYIFLSYASRGRFAFVEYPNSGPNDSAGYLPIVRLEGFEIDKNGDYQQHKKTYVSRRQSRYGFDWEDISTPEDRKLWIAGGRSRIVDLETNEIIAERIGFLIDPSQGGRVGGNSWLYSNESSCPKLSDDFVKNREFIYQVLRPSQGVVNGK